MTEHYSGHDPETGCALMLIVILLGVSFLLLGALLILDVHVSASRPAQIMPTVPILAVDESDPGRTGTPRRPIRAPESRPAPSPRRPTLSEAKRWARSVLSAAEWTCLDAIVKRESGWNPHAVNPDNGRYGLGQFSGFRDPDPLRQLRHILGYVDRRYGGACGAWSFWQARGWY